MYPLQAMTIVHLLPMRMLIAFRLEFHLDDAFLDNVELEDEVASNAEPSAVVVEVVVRNNSITKK